MSEHVGNTREITTELLKIHGNCLEFDNTIIQLSNVSMFTTENIDPIPFPTKSLMWILLGIVGIVLGSDDFFESEFFIFIGVFMLIIGAALIIAWLSKNSESENLTRLVIVTNSGNNFAILFNDLPFLEKVIDLLRSIVTNPSTSPDVTINIRDNEFNGDSSVIKEYIEKEYNGIIDNDDTEYEDK